MDVGIDAEKLKKRSERFGNAAVQAPGSDQYLVEF